MLELVDGNVTIWLGGRGEGGGVVTSFENWNPTAADVQGLGGIVLSLQKFNVREFGAHCRNFVS